VLAFSAGSVTVNDNTVTGTDHPSYGVAFVNTDAAVANGNTISSTSGALLDAGTINTPMSHAGNVYSGNDYNVVLEQDGSVASRSAAPRATTPCRAARVPTRLSGLGGNDTIVGGSGVDTAAYTATISTTGITDDGAGHFVVATGGSEGTDTLSGVEKIDGAGTHNILLVGNGGYATIQAAVNAAADGDTIEIAAGTYTEDVTITGKALTIDGVENGSANSVTLNGQITVAGTLNGAFAITDLNINATGKDYGVLVTANSTAFAGSVTLDDVSISNAKQDGFA
jgi:pectin methylesterase-like acyl-CoA thioesterase